MPYYRWRGVDIIGTYKKGYLFAKSPEHLDGLLLKREIALLKSKPIAWRFFIKKANLSLKIDFFRQLGMLLSSGVMLADALAIVGDQLQHPGIQEKAHAISDKINEGESFWQSAKLYPDLFDTIACQLIKTGEESGSLSSTCYAKAAHLQQLLDFKKQIKQALFMPLITFGFFLVVSGVLFVFVVPRFADIFSSLGNNIPVSTQRLIALSSFVRSFGMLILMGFIALFSFSIHVWFKSPTGKKVKNKLMVKLPFIGIIYTHRFVGSFLQSLSLLLENGLPLVPAIEVFNETMHNEQLQKHVVNAHYNITRGKSLSDALQTDELFSPELIAMVNVGQETGQLSAILSKAASVYHEKVARQLRILSSIIQPFFMLVLGLLITILIFSIYLPIMNLSEIA